MAAETLVKICGLTSAEEAGFLNRYGADMAGTVLFFPKSKRNVEPEKAELILAALDKKIKKCAVTVAPTAEQVGIINRMGYDYLQVHGSLDYAAYAAAELPVIKAFNVSDLDDFDRFSTLDKVAGYVFDAAEYGSGKVFDWKLLEKLPRDGRLFILAGGLDPENVSKAVRAVRPDCVDVSSGVENDSGIGKSEEKIKAFIKNAKSALYGQN